VALDDGPHDGQAQPRAALGPRALHPEKALENGVQVVRCDPDTGIANFDHHLIAARRAPHGDRTARRRVLDRVIDQMLQRQVEMFLIPHHGRQVVSPV